MLRKLVSILSALCLMAAAGFAASKGTSGAQFLKVIASPRAAAMGSAFVAVSGDVNSLEFNPAGLGYLTKKEVSLVQNSWIQDVSNQYFACGVPLGKIGVLGLAVTMMSVKDMIKRDNTGFADGTKFDAGDTAVQLAYAKALSNKLALGVNLKSISQKIENETASGMAVDVGIIYKISEKVDLGVSAQNNGSSIKFINEADPLPMIARIGAGIKLSETFKLNVDAAMPNDSDTSGSVGAEYCVKSGEKLIFPLRFGYKSGYETEQMSGLAAGAGVMYDNTYGIDLAWTPMGILGDSTKIGLVIKF